MLRIRPDQATPKIRALFASDAPANLRCWAVLEGILPGDILVDDGTEPTWGAVREVGGGTTFLSETMPADAGLEVVGRLRQTGNVVIGMWEDDPRWGALRCGAAEEGVNIEFLGRRMEQDLDLHLQPTAPEGHIERIDAAIFPHCAWYGVICRAYGRAETFLQEGLGFCLVGSDGILAEVYLTPAVHGMRELGIRTQETQRGKGYGTLMSAYGIRVCEQHGDRVYWNTARQNLASLAMARKFGFQQEREYPVRIWRSCEQDRR